MVRIHLNAEMLAALRRTNNRRRNCIRLVQSPRDSSPQRKSTTNEREWCDINNRLNYRVRLRLSEQRQLRLCQRVSRPLGDSRTDRSQGIVCWRFKKGPSLHRTNIGSRSFESARANVLSASMRSKIMLLLHTQLSRLVGHWLRLISYELPCIAKFVKCTVCSRHMTLVWASDTRLKLNDC